MSAESGYGFVEDVKDADLYVVTDSHGTRRIDFVDAVEYANKPLDEEVVKDHIKSNSGSVSENSAQVKSDKEFEEMKANYFDHTQNFHFELVLEYDGGNERVLRGEPRTDLNWSNLLFSSIIPFEFEDSSDERIIMREMRLYDKEAEKLLVEEWPFSGHGGYDWNFSRSVGTDEYDSLDKPDNFSYIPEPLDFLALNGYEGVNTWGKGSDEYLPPVSSPHWTILDVDSINDKIVGLRPHYDEIWDAGVSSSEAERLGRWFGVNRAIGRFLYDIDDEFFQASDDGEKFVGFYDNEIPCAVGADKAFDGDIWNYFFNDRFKEKAEEEDIDEIWLRELRKKLRDIEDFTEFVEEHPDYRPYTELIPQNVEQRHVPKSLRAEKIF